jgi:8-oxo-dGTP pyrophosphatase MutT (NUDIX family)
MTEFDKSKNFKKSTMNCNNCGSSSHIFKHCDSPIPSYGIILLFLDIENPIKTEIIDRLIDMKHDYNNENKEIMVNDFNDLELFSIMKNSIKMLLIQRKHSVGFIEFIRGRYNINNVEGIIFLFKQMTQYEIDKIKDGNFDDLWDYLWGCNKSKVAHFNDYNISKSKFEKLKKESSEYLNLNFYVNDIKPDYKYAEWGFPKGRKNNINEDILKAAQREFTEETNYCADDYILLDKIKPIEESLIGTNGINYKHIYYIAIAKTDQQPTIDEFNMNQINEIGDINFFLYEDAMKLVRPYHVEKKKIVTQLYMFIMNKIISIIKGM